LIVSVSLSDCRTGVGLSIRRLHKKQEVRRFDIFVHFAVAAARMRWRNRVSKSTTPSASRRVPEGSGLGGLACLSTITRCFWSKGPRRISPFFIPGIIAIWLPADRHPVRREGANLSIETACAASCHAVGESFRLIREGKADAMIAGGSEAW